MFIVNNKDTRTAPSLYCFSHIVLVFLLLTLNMQLPAGVVANPLIRSYLLTSIQHHPAVTNLWLSPSFPFVTAAMFIIRGKIQLTPWNNEKVNLFPESDFSYTITIYKNTANNIVHKKELKIKVDEIKLWRIQSGSFPSEVSCVQNNPKEFDKEDTKSEIAIHTIIWRAGVLISLNIKNVSIIMLEPNTERTVAVVSRYLLVIIVAWVIFIFLITFTIVLIPKR